MSRIKIIQLTFLLLLLLSTNSCMDCDDESQIFSDGVWNNKDSLTRGITRFEIKQNSTIIHLFGSCAPQDCDWGETQLISYNQTFKAFYNHGYATRDVKLVHLENESIELTIFNDYTEEDGREDFEIIDCFNLE